MNLDKEKWVQEFEFNDEEFEIKEEYSIYENLEGNTQIGLPKDLVSYYTEQKRMFQMGFYNDGQGDDPWSKEMENRCEKLIIQLDDCNENEFIQIYDSEFHGFMISHVDVGHLIQDMSSSRHKEVWMEYKCNDGEICKVRPFVASYNSNGNLCLGLEDIDEYGEMSAFGYVTVNTAITMPYLCAAIDTNNMGEGVINFLLENDFGEFTGRAVASGYCEFPIFQFNEDKLMELDYDGLVEYKRNIEYPSLEVTVDAAEYKHSSKEDNEKKSRKVIVTFELDEDVVKDMDEHEINDYISTELEWLNESGFNVKDWSFEENKKLQFNEKEM